MAQCNKEIGLLKCTGRGKHKALSLEGQAGVGGRMESFVERRGAQSLRGSRVGDNFQDVGRTTEFLRMMCYFLL